jgi:hypothetical protein
MGISARTCFPVLVAASASFLGLYLAAAVQGSGPGQEFRAPDGSFSCPVPAGWKVQTTTLGGSPVHVFEPPGGGEDRILVTSGPAPVGSIQEFAQIAMAFVCQQLLPGVQPAGPPNFTQVGGLPAVEISYKGQSAAGPVSWWQGILIKDRTYFAVLGGARSERAVSVEKESRAILGGLRPSEAPASSDLAASIIGSWSFYDRSGVTGGASNKQITFYPNGRFEYTATTYMPNLPVDVDPTTRAAGNYRLNGNMLVVQLDSGQTATYTLQLVPGGGLSINGEMFIRER